MDRELATLTTGMPCSAQGCYDNAIHVVTAKFTYHEKRWDASIQASRWVPDEESVVLYLCRKHRNRWIRRSTTIKKGETLL